MTVLAVTEHSHTMLASFEAPHQTIIVASKIGKGKVLVSGDAGHCSLLTQQQDPLMRNLLKWFNGGIKPHFHDVRSLLKHKHELQKPGGIILWKLYYNVSKETTDLVRDLVSSGKAGLMLAVKMWTMKADLIHVTHSCLKVAFTCLLISLIGHLRLGK